MRHKSVSESVELPEIRLKTEPSQSEDSFSYANLSLKQHFKGLHSKHPSREITKSSQHKQHKAGRLPRINLSSQQVFGHLRMSTQDNQFLQVFQPDAFTRDGGKQDENSIERIRERNYLRSEGRHKRPPAPIVFQSPLLGKGNKVFRLCRSRRPKQSLLCSSFSAMDATFNPG